MYVQTRYNPELSNPEQSALENTSCDPDFNSHLKATNGWLEKVRKRVKRAIENQKIFVVYGNYRSVRKALVNRGWIQKPAIQIRSEDCAFLSDDIIEKLDWHKIRRHLPKPEDNESPLTYFQKYRSVVIAVLLRNIEPDFYWDFGPKKPVPKNSMLNRIANSSFTSKAGLCASLEQMHWFTQGGVSYVQFPRCYTTKNFDTIQDFVDDYRLTACMSLLKQVVYLYEICSITNLDSATGSIPLSSIQFAIDACKNYIHCQNHEDLDESIETTFNQIEWDSFLRHQYLVVHKGEKFIEQQDLSLESLVSTSKNVLEEMSILWPQYKIDGRFNLWVIKPGNSSRGWGIKLADSYHSFASIITQVPTKLNYVFQKYVESPLLIYNTKFDIRQWFLVTSAHPLVIWMYCECYIRFSTQNFNLKNYHESIHLTNFAIQKKYKNGPRDSSLPRENMWDFSSFKKYLKETGNGHVWDLVIFPGMKQAIVATMLANQENLDNRPKCFQLYGADFILGDDFTPWLLEINSSPDMSHSTTVTTKLCPECFEDLIKVVVDYSKNPMTETGQFQLIYRQEESSCMEHYGLSMVVFGDKMIIYPRPPPNMSNTSDNYYSAVINLRDRMEVPTTIPVEDDCAIIGWDSSPSPMEENSTHCGVQVLQRHDLVKNRMINLRPSKASCNLTVRREIQSTFASRMRERKKGKSNPNSEFSKRLKFLFQNENPQRPMSANYSWENVSNIIRSTSTISERSGIFDVTASSKKGPEMCRFKVSVAEKINKDVRVEEKLEGNKPREASDKKNVSPKRKSRSPVKNKKPKLTKNASTLTEKSNAKTVFYEKYVKPSEGNRKLKFNADVINAMYEESKRRCVSPQALRQELNFKNKL